MNFKSIKDAKTANLVQLSTWLFDNEKERKEMGKNAKVWAETNLMEDNIDKWLKVYEKAINKID